MTEISEDDIRLRAYALWESDGRPAGSHDVHWLQALRELTEEAGASTGETQKMGDTPKKPAKSSKPKAAAIGEPVRPAARKRSKPA